MDWLREMTGCQETWIVFLVLVQTWDGNIYALVLLLVQQG